MSESRERTVPPRIDSAVVVRVEENRCFVTIDGSIVVAAYSPQFPSPRLERVSPGHRVAMALTSDGRRIALWRWYDAVVIDTEGDLVRLWEPAHGEVLASPRDASIRLVPGTRAYLSAGLPGADWWVAGPVDEAQPAPVELDEVQQLYARHDLWSSVVHDGLMDDQLDS